MRDDYDYMEIIECQDGKVGLRVTYRRTRYSMTIIDVTVVPAYTSNHYMEKYQKFIESLTKRTLHDLILYHNSYTPIAVTDSAVVYDKYLRVMEGK